MYICECLCECEYVYIQKQSVKFEPRPSFTRQSLVDCGIMNVHLHSKNVNNDISRIFCSYSCQV